MDLFEKISWFITNSEDGSFDNLKNEDWLRIEAEITELISKTLDRNILDMSLNIDIHYVIPYSVRIYLHKRLIEIDPKSEKAIRDYAFYLKAFGDLPEELIADEMIKNLG